MEPILVIMGATASGKSTAALELAERFGAEIVSADSMQLYRGLDIGTAKPTGAEQARVPHHLLDVRDMAQPADVYSFIADADAAVRDIQARNRRVIVAGGTGMYLKAWLYGLDELPGDAAVRAELDREYDNPAGFGRLKSDMAEIDPVDLEHFGHHRRKLIRALEVFRLTGTPLAELQGRKERTLRYDVVAWYLDWPREELKARIAARTRQMLRDGWIDEARPLLAAGLLETPTAHQALGYRPIGEYLAGRLTLEELTGRIATATWQLARRQITWFKHQHPEARTIPMPRDFREITAWEELGHG